MPESSPVALVTGSAKRVGAAIARGLHADGYDLALHYRHSGEAMQALASELEAARPHSVLTLHADLAEFDRLPELIARTVGHYGRLDALVNNASAYYATPIGQATPQQWDELFASNARAPFFLAQAAAPHLKASHGAIVSIADIYAERPLGGHTVYCMAKAALVMMTKSLARELGPEVRVNAVAPGNVLWSENPVKAETLELVHARTALKRQGAPDDIVSAVRWLLGGNGYITGQVIAIDGGRSLFI
ncbi:MULTISPECIES: pteridine reductase [unclassified Pseudoxanthomonas]|jgi:pteridine reductase|uniref:pteridine reductase n=1 Tax=unclassified Pseudoxanthomonas TaxID=2645906 RepID=UPI0016203711|nr:MULTISPECIES: pteridine reductase [unclassified Pseudoxanthomonas]MBB3276515.1 pteridine reductase [Pseudoxanthomonas sp. OG2]MBD9377419.1 pteridine reductase [Pseudoxanthomonas sp. PXM04]MBV7472410.1 pteridine reductase [Pseudoxanthomonas sp. PXM05]